MGLVAAGEQGDSDHEGSEGSGRVFNDDVFHNHYHSNLSANKNLFQVAYSASYARRCVGHYAIRCQLAYSVGESYAPCVAYYAPRSRCSLAPLSPASVLP